MLDQGFTHVALPVSNLENSIAFYATYAGMKVVHRRAQREQPDRGVAWLSDLTRPFVLVLAETTVERALGPFAHLGVACETRDEVDRLTSLAIAEGCFRDGPHGDAQQPSGYLVNLVAGEKVSGTFSSRVSQLPSSGGKGS